MIAERFGVMGKERIQNSEDRRQEVEKNQNSGGGGGTRLRSNIQHPTSDAQLSREDEDGRRRRRTKGGRDGRYYTRAGSRCYTR